MTILAFFQVVWLPCILPGYGNSLCNNLKILIHDVTIPRDSFKMYLIVQEIQMGTVKVREFHFCVSVHQSLKRH